MTQTFYGGVYCFLRCPSVSQRRFDFALYHEIPNIMKSGDDYISYLCSYHLEIFRIKVSCTIQGPSQVQRLRIMNLFPLHNLTPCPILKIVHTCAPHCEIVQIKG